MENRWFLAKSLKLPTRKTQDDGKVTLSVQHLCANQSVAFKGGEQVDLNQSWLVENVAPALPSMTDAVHTERRHRLQNGRLAGTNTKFCSQGSVISPRDSRMARSCRFSSRYRGSFSSVSGEWTSERHADDSLISDTLPSILISPPMSKVELLHVKGTQKDLCSKNTDSTASPRQNNVRTKLPYPVMKSYRFKGKGNSKTTRERMAVPFKAFNFCDDKALPSVRVWRTKKTVELATMITLLPKGTY
ncbi:uncharacterized protein LOC144915987 [Branchiostoma floridae x Branchiostoma belcheri]